MPIGYSGYGTYGGNYGIRGYNSLFDRYRQQNEFDIGIDDDELKRIQEKIQKDRTQRIQDIEGKTRKERFIQALPFIAAAIVGDDRQSVQALMSFAELKADEERRLKEYKQRQKEIEREAELSRERREDIQEFENKQQSRQFDFRTGERISSQEFKRQERIASQQFDLRKEDRRFRQDLIKMGYDNELTTELEEIRHNNRIEQQELGFLEDVELFRRQTSTDLAERMESQGITPDIARSVSEKVTLGIPKSELNPIEQEALNTYRDLSKATSQQERDLALLESARRVMATGVPVLDEEGNPVVDKVLGKALTRQLHPSEVLPFMIEGAEEGMRRLASPENPAPQEQVEQFEDEITYSNASEFINSNDEGAKVLRKEAQRIDSESRATELTISLYKSYKDPRIVQSMIDNLPTEDKYKKVMSETLQELIASEQNRLEILRGISKLNNPDLDYIRNR